MLRALAARKLLQQRKFLRHRAVGKPVIHACRSGNDRPKDQVADYSAIQMDLWNDGSVWLADIQQPRLYALSTAHK